jgi:hypothetical protein
MFRKAIVLDIITHPNSINQIIDKLIKPNKDISFKSKKKELLKDLPRNSIIAIFSSTNEAFVAMPFFSSHLGLPIKPNEEVWIYEDSTSSNERSIEFFWISRIHNVNFIEDVNYTHPDRKFLKNYNDESNENINLNVIMPPFNNGPIRDPYNIQNDLTLSKIDKKIKMKFDITGNWLRESIPRFTKNPGDYVIQGSNNTLIKLGTNNIRKSSDNLFEKYNSSNAFNGIESNSGTIDIVAGRCGITHSLLTNKELKRYVDSRQQQSTGLLSVDVFKNAMFSIYNEAGYLENTKDNLFYFGSKNQNLAEGDTDFFTDISRLYISEKCKGDELLNYASIYSIDINGKQKLIDKSKKRGFIIGKSDEIRLVARNPVFNRNYENTLSNVFLEPEAAGSIKLIKEGGEDLAYIALEHDGSITIDGPKIVIGDKKREQNNGLGNNVYLGNDAIEPIILGFQLKERLESFMDQVILGFNKIGEALNQLNEHNHAYAGPAGNTSGPNKGIKGTLQYIDTDIKDYKIEPTQDITTFDEQQKTLPDISSKESLQDIITNINTIKKELDKTLSKLVKTN